VNKHITISKENKLPKAQDYYFLRSEGIKHLEKLGSKIWTDFNLHDPGITIKETLCYAITELAYRASFKVEDLLAEEQPEWFNPDEQAFFTAREIFTTAPWTTRDYRKLLIDLQGITNAWINCSSCHCGPKIYVDCKKSELTFTEPVAPEIPEEHEVIPKGLYDVLLELENHEQYGDLNTGKINYNSIVTILSESETVYLEIRFPSLKEFKKLIKTEPKFGFWTDSKTAVTKVECLVIHNIKNQNADISPAMLATALRGGMYAAFRIEFSELVTDPVNATKHTVELKNIPFRFLQMKRDVRLNIKLSDLRTMFTADPSSGIVAEYQNKMQAADEALKDASESLMSHRNIAEDFCCVDEVQVEEFGICTDIEVTPEADIEQVLSEVFYRIQEYLNPSVKFYSLSDLLDKKTVEEIFEGPKLEHGFIDEDDLDRSVLNRTLYSSDIINLIMDVPGVVSLKNFMLVRFDNEGNNVESDPWKLKVKSFYVPRFYLEGSKFLIFKNNLPFLPDYAEILDTMQLVKGRNLMPKLKDHELDLPVPTGKYSGLDEYVPVQNSLPLVYGTGYHGLPKGASGLRKAQAKQLKSYLTFFDQLLVNYLGQLANLKNLFSVNTDVKQSYFPVLLENDSIKNDLYSDMFSDFYLNFSKEKLLKLSEDQEDFAERRNRFLDHLIARFSESFTDYALLLFSYKSHKITPAENLINIKGSFLKQFSLHSSCKAQSFDYTDHVNIDLRKDLSSIHKRIGALLGLEPSLNYFRYNISRSGNEFVSDLTLVDIEGKVLFKLPYNESDSDRNGLLQGLNLLMALIVRLAPDKTKYKIIEVNSKYKIQLGDPQIMIHPSELESQADAEAFVDSVVKFATENLSDERFIIVEHLLLRPHTNSDNLLPVCVESDCEFCGEEDPYSYRLTFVFDGESELAKEHFEFRKFAENTIRAEVPAHLLVKICWVETKVYNDFNSKYLDWLIAVPAKKSTALNNLIEEFKKLKSIYPPPTLHDCVDGNDENRVFLNHTQL
jgi:hypothetical protein